MSWGLGLRHMKLGDTVQPVRLGKEELVPSSEDWFEETFFIYFKNQKQEKLEAGFDMLHGSP